MTEETGAIETTEAPAEAAQTTEAVAEDARFDFVNDKYRVDGRSEQESLELQAKSYNELSSKFGAFTGAPDEYAVALTDELADAGVVIDKDDPLIEQAMEFAKNSNMSQDGFKDMVNLYAMTQVAEQKAIQDNMAEEMKALGSNAEKRIAGINDWANANLDAETVAGLQEAATTAAGIKAIEALISKTRGAPVAAENVQPAASVTKSELSDMQFALDDYGNRRINTDPAYKAEYRKKMEALYGNEPNRQIMGS